MVEIFLASIRVMLDGQGAKAIAPFDDVSR